MQKNVFKNRLVPVCTHITTYCPRYIFTWRKNYTFKFYTYIGAIAASIEDDPEMSIRHRSAQVVNAKESTWHIMRLELGLHSYISISANSKAKAATDVGRRSKCLPIIFSDEAHF